MENNLDVYLPCKIHAGQYSKEVQEILFKLGCDWIGNIVCKKEKIVFKPNETPFIFVNSKKIMTRCDASNLDRNKQETLLKYFLKDNYQQITIETLYELSNLVIPEDEIIQFIKDECDFGHQKNNIIKIVEMILNKINDLKEKTNEY